MLALLFAWSSAPSHAATHLDKAELQYLEKVLDGLKAGNSSDPEAVERLSGADFDCLVATERSYVELEGEPPHQTHLAFQILLERLSRWTLNPRSLAQMYSGPGRLWTSLSVQANPLAQPLFEQLLRGNQPRLSHDLCVRLTPSCSLAFIRESLASADVDSAHLEGLLAAWNRRLSTGAESRDLPGLAGVLEDIAAAFDPAEPPRLLAEHLGFLGRWKVLEEHYRESLQQCLAADSAERVLVGLNVQEDCPALLRLNGGLLLRFPDHETLASAAIRNFGYDSSQDYSSTLRAIWALIGDQQLKRKFYCLYAMGVHSAGNADIALTAIRSGESSFFEPGLQILSSASEEQLSEGIQFILNSDQGGLEGALRLAHEHRIGGFENRAVAIFQAAPDQIVKQAALHYLQMAPGSIRVDLLDALKDPNDDIRLAAIQLYDDPRGMNARQRQKVGVALTRVYIP